MTPIELVNLVGDMDTVYDDGYALGMSCGPHENPHNVKDLGYAPFELGFNDGREDRWLG